MYVFILVLLLNNNTLKKITVCLFRLMSETAGRILTKLSQADSLGII